MITPNLIINGNFDLWQRGTTFSIAKDAKWSNLGIGTTLTAQSELIADRWYAIDNQQRTAGSTGQISLYQETLSSPISGIQGNSKYYLTTENQITGITSGYLYIENKQENAKSYMNMPLTLTFAAKSLNGITGITMSCYYRQAINPGTTENSYENTSEITLTPYWKSYSVNFTVAPFTISGLSGSHYFAVGFKIHPETSLSIASVKLQSYSSEVSGTLITDPEEEKYLQSKYYFSTYKNNATRSSVTLVNNNDVNAFRFTVTPNYSVNYAFPKEMYKSPTIYLHSPQSGMQADGYNKSAGKDMRLTSGTRGWNQATRFSPTGAATITASGNTYGVELNVSSGAVVFDDILVHIVADADLNFLPYDKGPQI